MRYRFKSVNLRTFGYTIFFFTIIDNRFMIYTPVLAFMYLLRFIYAVKGYYLAVTNLKATGKTAHPKLLLLQLAYSITIITSGIVNHTNTFGIYYSVLIWIGITQFILNSNGTNHVFLKTMDCLFKWIVVITLVLTILIPGVMITYSYDGSKIVEGFFGGKNALPMYILAGMCLNFLVYEVDGKRKVWRCFLYPLICTLFLYASGSGTGLVIATTFLILFCTKSYKLLNVYNIIIIQAAITFSIVIFRLHETYLYPVIVDILHRDMTLTYRTDIWSIAIMGFLNNWFLGCGLGNEVIAQNLVLPIWYELIINETHNGFLDVALSLGVLGLIPFMLLLIYIIRKYDKAENKCISQLMKLYVFVYFVGAITESAFTLSKLMFWSMLCIGLVMARKTLKSEGGRFVING